jgi:hypothetical protein
LEVISSQIASPYLLLLAAVGRENAEKTVWRIASMRNSF